MKSVIVYSREGCHLCEDLLDDLARLAEAHGFSVVERDVDSDPQWHALYNERVPVVEVGGEVICEYFLDPQGVLARMAERR